MRIPRRPVLLLLLVAHAWPLRAWDAAVAIRYLQASGKSHGTVYLFSSDGKLVRPLSEPGPHQDGLPVFSPDASEVIFTRQLANNGGNKLFIVGRDGGKARPVEGTPPAWYGQRRIAKFFADEDNGIEATEPETKNGVTSYPSPDGAFALVTKPDAKDDEHPLAFLREGKTGPLQPLASMPGFSIFWFPLRQKNSPFLLLPHLKVAFYEGEHDSTTGTAAYALELEHKRIYRLSENGASVVPWPGHSGFFSLTSSRYEPLDQKRTANCSYLDWYDADMKRTRFGHSLGIFYGASIYLKGEEPLTLPEPTIGD